jgi:hypothetical protein
LSDVHSFDACHIHNKTSYDKKQQQKKKKEKETKALIENVYGYYSFRVYLYKDIYEHLLDKCPGVKVGSHWFSLNVYSKNKK